MTREIAHEYDTWEKSRFVKCAPHEGDVYFTICVHPSERVTDHGLAPYYAVDSLMNEWDDRWQEVSKPTEEIQFLGGDWGACFDYSSCGLNPWDNPQFKIHEVREFQFYFISKESPHDEQRRADWGPVKRGLVHHLRFAHRALARVTAASRPSCWTRRACRRRLIPAVFVEQPAAREPPGKGQLGWKFIID